MPSIIIEPNIKHYSITFAPRRNKPAAAARTRRQALSAIVPTTMDGFCDSGIVDDKYDSDDKSCGLRDFDERSCTDDEFVRVLGDPDVSFMQTLDYPDDSLAHPDDSFMRASDYPGNESHGMTCDPGGESFIRALDYPDDGDKCVWLKWYPEWLNSRIPVAKWRLERCQIYNTRIPIAKWRWREFYMEKKNKVYRGTATSFGFKRPVSAPTTKTVSSTVPSANQPPVNTAPTKGQLTDSNESLIIGPTTRTGTPRLSRPKKDLVGATGRTNRFGFRAPPAMSNKVADSQTQNNTVSTKPIQKDSSALPVVKSHLPRPQLPVRLVAHPARTASADKSAKTQFNNNAARRSRSANCGSSASSINNDGDSGVGSQKSGGELEPEQLECSPSARRLHKKTRQIFATGNEKKFELKDLKNAIEVTETLELPPLPLSQLNKGVRNRLGGVGLGMAPLARQQSTSSDDEGIEDESGEEKLHRDCVLSEKDEKGVLGAGEEEADVDDMWGNGEAMAGEEEMNIGVEMDCDTGRRGGTPPLRSVLLSIEDQSFAALAAMSTSIMLEDEPCPEVPDLSLVTIVSPGATVDSPKQPLDGKKNDSPDSPGTPTHNSGSLSFSSDIRCDRDFIDDEICDQPGLVYDQATPTAHPHPSHDSSGNTLVADIETPKINLKPLSAVPNLTVDCGASGRLSSAGTLSPCDSLTSEDLIMDYDISAVDDDHRLDTCSFDVGLTDDEKDDEATEQALQELSSLLASRPEVLGRRVH